MRACTAAPRPGGWGLERVALRAAGASLAARGSAADQQDEKSGADTTRAPFGAPFPFRPGAACTPWRVVRKQALCAGMVAKTGPSLS
jgi:hypothetical protein